MNTDTMEYFVNKIVTLSIKGNEANKRHLAASEKCTELQIERNKLKAQISKYDKLRVDLGRYAESLNPRNQSKSKLYDILKEHSF